MPDLVVFGTTWAETGWVSARVVVDEGMIISVEPTTAAGREDLVLDPGTYLAPGLIDTQINGYLGIDFTTEPTGLGLVADRLPATGVTAFCPTIITTDPATEQPAIEALSAFEPPPGAAVPIGIHREGPFLSSAAVGAHDPALIRVPTTKAVDEINASGTAIVTLAPEVAGGLGAISTLAAAGVVVSVGHTSADYAVAVAAFEAGATALTHVCNAMPGLHHRAPGPISAAADAGNVMVGLIADGVHVEPPMMRVLWRIFGPNRLMLVTDAIAGAGMREGTYMLGGAPVHVDAQGARRPDGVLAGSTLDLPQAVASILACTPATLHDAVRMAACNPARVLRDPARGRIAAGARADLVVLNAYGQPLATWVAGHPAFPPPVGGDG